jgi:hypothetical protein
MILLGLMEEQPIIEMLAGLNKPHRQYARKMACLFDLAYFEAHGDSRLLEDLLVGQHRPDILYFKPGKAVATQSFQDSGKIL